MGVMHRRCNKILGKR